MNFGAEPANALLQAVQVIATAAIGAYVAIYGQRLASGTKALKDRLDAEQKRCDGLERRLKSLESSRRRARKPPKRK